MINCPLPNDARRSKLNNKLATSKVTRRIAACHRGAESTRRKEPRKLSRRPQTVHTQAHTYANASKTRTHTHTDEHTHARKHTHTPRTQTHLHLLYSCPCGDCGVPKRSRKLRGEYPFLSGPRAISFPMPQGYTENILYGPRVSTSSSSCLLNAFGTPHHHQPRKLSRFHKPYTQNKSYSYFGPSLFYRSPSFCWCC